MAARGGCAFSPGWVRLTVIRPGVRGGFVFWPAACV
jgi:hypothetical protein